MRRTVSEHSVGRVFDALRKCIDGASCARIADELGLQPVTVSHAMRVLRDRGIAATSFPVGGRFARWCEIHRLEHVRNVVRDSTSDADDLRRRRERYHDVKSGAKRAESDDPVRIIRSAVECEPLRPRGPRSVFELA
jgi:hypothetical protein